MEPLQKTTQIKKRKDTKLQTIYSRCLLTRKVVLSVKNIGKNLDDIIEEYIRNNFEGKCLAEGYIKQNSIKIIRYSSGVIERGNNIIFEVVFECDICFPVEGMLISCRVKNIVKAGIHAESSSETPSPVVVFVAKDHHFNNSRFNETQVGDIITVRVVGQRFELNDKYIAIIGELYKEKDFKKQPSKPRLVIED